MHIHLIQLRLCLLCAVMTAGLFCTEKKPQITTIFTDIEGVLTTASPIAFISHIGLSTFAGSILFDWHGPAYLKAKMYEVIKRMGDDSGVLPPYPNGEQPTHGPSPMAKNIALWQSDSKHYSSRWILSKALETIDVMDKEQRFASAREKNLIQKMAQFSFLPEGAETKKLIKPVVKLIEKIHNQKNTDGTRKYRLVIISNIATDGYWQALKKKFPKLFNLFDGYVLSGDIGLIKPDQKIYEYALEQYNAKPEESVFLDDKIENVHAAQKVIRPGQKMGMHGIHVKKSDGYASVKSELEKLGVLPA